MFAKDETIENILKTLPETWTIVQISTINSHAFSRFKQTQKDLSLKEGNPNLCFIRLSNDGTPGQIRTVVSKDESCVVPYLQEIQTILKVKNSPFCAIIPHDQASRVNTFILFKQL